LTMAWAAVWSVWMLVSQWESKWVGRTWPTTSAT
jgi:hypothetical protein